MRRASIIQLFDDLRQSGFDVTEFNFQPPSPAITEEIGGMPLPQAVKDLYRTEFGGIQTRYNRKLDLRALGAFGESIGANYLYGGPVLLQPNELDRAKSHALEWAEAVWSDEDEDEYKIWRSTAPLIYIRNGDYIGFNGKGQAVYLCHDGESFVVASNFDSFFAAWENVFFIGPEWWMLEPLSNSRKKLLKSSQRIRQFRSAFQALLNAA